MSESPTNTAGGRLQINNCEIATAVLLNVAMRGDRRLRYGRAHPGHRGRVPHTGFSVQVKRQIMVRRHKADGPRYNMRLAVER